MVRQTVMFWKEGGDDGGGKPEPTSRILITAGGSTSRRLICSTVGFIGITDADKVIASREIKHF